MILKYYSCWNKFQCKCLNKCTCYVVYLSLFFFFWNGIEHIGRLSQQNFSNALEGWWWNAHMVRKHLLNELNLAIKQEKQTQWPEFVCNYKRKATQELPVNVGKQIFHILVVKFLKLKCYKKWIYIKSTALNWRANLTKKKKANTQHAKLLSFNYKCRK